MSTYDLMMLIGWVVLIASWFPKKWFIKDDHTRNLINVWIAAMSLTIFLAACFAKFFYTQV